MSDKGTGVVLDIGSFNSKVGFAGESFPRAVFPTAVGRFRRPGLLDGFPLVYCGREAIQNRGLSQLTWPVHSGTIQDWNEIEKLWHHIFYKELHVPPEEATVLHVVHPEVSKTDREKMAEILFEAFAIKGLNLVNSAILALHASKRTTGVVLEMGHSCSFVVPVYEGFPLKNATVNSPLGGELLTKRLQKLLTETGYSFTTAAEQDILNTVKEEKCYVANNFQDEIEMGKCTGLNMTPHKLPDGQVIMLGDDRIRTMEVLFNPSLEMLNCQNIVNTICHSIDKTDLDNRALFYNNIVVAGGSSMIPGLIERLKTDLAKKKFFSEQHYKASVDALPSRQYLSWIGGSIVASLNCLKGFYMTREEYEDVGPDRVNYKFF